jgi:Rrf2 family protein
MSTEKVDFNVLTRRTAYALRALLHLAESPGFCGSARELSGAEAVPRRFLEAILRELLRQGLVESRRGQAGGYVLSKPPAQLSVAEIVRAVDGDLFPFVCLSAAPRRCAQCPGEGVCPTERALVGLPRLIWQHLETQTLADLARDSATRNAILGFSNLETGME